MELPYRLSYRGDRVTTWAACVVLLELKNLNPKKTAKPLTARPHDELRQSSNCVAHNFPRKSDVCFATIVVFLRNVVMREHPITFHQPASKLPTGLPCFVSSSVWLSGEDHFLANTTKIQSCHRATYLLRLCSTQTTICKCTRIN